MRAYLSTPSRAFLVNSTILRISLGLILFHRAISIYGALPSSEHQMSIASAALGAASIALSFGLATPLSALIAGSLNLELITNLGPMVAMMACIYLAISPSGLLLSVDRLLVKKSTVYRCFYQRYLFTLPSPSASRLILIVLFAGVSWSAMLFHANDELWLRGAVLPALFATPYLNDYYSEFAYLQRTAGPFLNALLAIVIYIQGFFELFSWFFLRFKLMRLFVFSWGMGFFAASILFMNLSYLPVIEVFVWIALFNYPDTLPFLHKCEIIFDDSCGLCHSTVSVLRALDIFDNFRINGFSSVESSKYFSRHKLNPNGFYCIERSSEVLFCGFDAYKIVVKNSLLWFLYPLMWLVGLSRCAADSRPA
jgi:hypothetical protein